MADTPHEPTPLNVPGPFYVGRDEYISCRAPEHEAPDLMSYDEERGSCYFARQPSTPEETERACKAVWVACCGAVRYAGSDPKILERLAELQIPRRSLTPRPWWKSWRR